MDEEKSWRHRPKYKSRRNNSGSHNALVTASLRFLRRPQGGRLPISESDRVHDDFELSATSQASLMLRFRDSSPCDPTFGNDQSVCNSDFVNDFKLDAVIHVCVG